MEATEAGEAIKRKESIDYAKTEEIFQNEYGITTTDDPKSILVTYGLVNCVGIVGFNPEQKIGFLAHYQDNTDIDGAFGTLLYWLSRITRGERRIFKVKIVGGVHGMLEELVKKLRAKLNQNLRDDIKFEIIKEDVLQHGVKGKDVGINTKTGEFISSYSPLNNPNHREPYPQYIKELIFQSKTPVLHYFPERFR